MMFAPQRALAGVAPGDHLCWVYDSDEEHRSLVTFFLRQGLERREKVIYVADEHPAETILGYLRASDLDPAPHLRDGSLRFRKPEDVYLRDGCFDPERTMTVWRQEIERALAEGYRAVRVTGEDLWRSSGVPGLERWGEYERRVTSVLPGSACLALCQYRRDRASLPWCRGGIEAHPVIIGGPLEPAAAGGEAAALTVDGHGLPALLEALPLAAMLVDAEHCCRSVNARYEEWFGVRRAAARGLPVRALLGKRAYRDVRPAIRAALSGTPAAFETELGGRPVHGACIPHFDGGRQVTGVLAVINELTLPRGTEQEMLRTLFDHAPAMLAVVDATGIKRVNREWERVLGWTREELKKGDVLAELYPDAAYRREVLAVIRSAKSEWREFRPRARDGRFLETRWASFPLPGGAAICIGQDISERKRAIPESGEHLRALIENALDAIAVLEADGAIRYESPSVERLLGYRPEELIGRSVFELMHPDDVGRAMEVFRRGLAEGGLMGPMEVRCRHKDGSWRTLEGIANNLLAFEGVAGVVVNCHDVTERKRAEQELDQHRELLEKIIDHIPVMIAMLDAGGQIRFMNRHWQRALGWTLEDAQTRDLLAECYPEEAYRREVLDFIVAAMGQWRDFRTRTRDGRTLDTAWISIRLSDGTLIGIGEDISERKRAELSLRRSEEQFRALIEQSSDITTILSPEGTIRYSSPSVERALGYKPEELENACVFDLIHPEDLPGLKAEFELGLKDPGMMRAVEVRVRHRDGSWRVFEGQGNNFLQVDGLNGVVVNARDITERRQLEAQLRHVQRMDAVGQLAGGVAHEFSNLLSVMLFYAELVAEQLEPQHPVRADVDEILKAAARASEVTAQLLTFSRRQAVHEEVLDLNELVQKMVRTLGPMLGELIRLEPALSAAPVRVKADRLQLEQVFLNLALNARDAMPAGGSLRIETDLLPNYSAAASGLARGDYVLLTVSDSGRGMTAAVRGRMFEPFFSTKETGKGTGLGLSTVYGIIKRHGGAITVESEPGRGATFRIYLPAAPEPAPGGPA